MERRAESEGQRGVADEAKNQRGLSAWAWNLDFILHVLKVHWKGIRYLQIISLIRDLELENIKNS